jgi:hypothetical protein
MKLTIEPTRDFFMCGEVMVRMWTGRTDSGEPVSALVACVVAEAESAELTRALVSIPEPEQSEAERWARTVLARGAEPDA